MRNTVVLMILFGGFFLSCGTKSSLPPVLEHNIYIRNSSGELVPEMDEMIKQLTKAEVVFVGEVHNDSLTHIVELELLKRIFQRNHDIAVSLEMFERDVQKSLDDYLDGKITEENFLSVSRPWNNYKTAYRPLIEFAKEKDFPVLAMNVPRRYANRVAMMGETALAALSDSERVWIARKLKPLEDEYKKRFMKEMGGGRPGPMMRFNPENLYKAQCLKDDTMAESIAEFLKKHPGTKIVSYEGDFHSDYGLGIVKKLKLLNPSVITFVISIVPVEDLRKVKIESFKNRGDFLIFVQKIVKE